MLSSNDDFYQCSSGLAVTETTLENENATLWRLVGPQSVMVFVRSMVANRLASSPSEWSEIFSRHNSGTYNNEWMVLDFNAFTRGAPLPAGAFYVLEQMPGQIVSQDMTAYLNEHKAWTSFNRPFFADIFDLSNQSAMVHAYGDHYSWSNTARSRIFERLLPSVVDEPSYKKAIRFNEFGTDSLGRQERTSVCA